MVTTRFESLAGGGGGAGRWADKRADSFFDLVCWSDKKSWWFAVRVVWMMKEETDDGQRLKSCERMCLMDLSACWMRRE